MRFFNALQCVILYAILPFVLSWVSEETFKGASAAFWVGVAIYVVATFYLIWAVYLSFDDRNW